MIIKRNNKMGQSILEYAIVLAVVITVLGVMQIYFKRGIQSVVRAAADEVGDQKQGLLEYDYKNERKTKGSLTTSTYTVMNTADAEYEGGTADYVTKEWFTRRTGTSSGGLFLSQE